MKSEVAKTREENKALAMSARPALLDCRSHRWGSENWLSRLHFRGQHFTTALTESASVE